MAENITDLKRKTVKLVRYAVVIALAILITAFICDRLLFFFAPWLPADTARSLSANAKLRRVVKAQDSHAWIFDEGIRYAKAGIVIDGYRTDAFGYRNPPGYLQRNGKADILLLGDSFTWGTAKRTIADYLRETLSPATVYSSGMGGEGIPQWAQHYRRFVSLTKVPPRVVVLNLYAGNDFSDLMLWHKVKRRFGTVHAASYFTYAQDDTFSQIGLTWGERNLTLMELRSLWKHFQYRMSADKDWDGSIAVLPDDYPPSRFYVRHEPDQAFLTNGLADEIRAVVTTIRQESPETLIMLSYIPTSGALYGEAIHDCADCGKDVSVQAQISQWLENLSASLAIAYWDATPELQKVALKEVIWSGTHFNALGYKLYAHFLSEGIQTLVKDNQP